MTSGLMEWRSPGRCGVNILYLKNPGGDWMPYYEHPLAVPDGDYWVSRVEKTYRKLKRLGWKLAAPKVTTAPGSNGETAAISREKA